MKLLTLLLTLSSGETDRITMPAWECRQMQATMEQAWASNAVVARDDGITVTSADCVKPEWADLITIPSNGDCDMGEEA